MNDDIRIYYMNINTFIRGISMRFLYDIDQCLYERFRKEENAGIY